jgi:hypothetical protein
VRKALRLIAVAFAVIIGGLQFVRPERHNPVGESAHALEQKVNVPPEVEHVLTRACKDCHSNETNWPWYSNVAPVSWFVADHVKEGRDELNFSEWPYSPQESGEVLEVVCHEVKSGSMPLKSYTILHPEAKLTDADVKTICDWAASEGRRLAAAAANPERRP